MPMALRDAYQEVLTAARLRAHPDRASPPRLHEDSDARFWYAEDYHQQYLFKNPGGYECHARTGLACPALPQRVIGDAGHHETGAGQHTRAGPPRAYGCDQFTPRMSVTKTRVAPPGIPACGTPRAP